MKMTAMQTIKSISMVFIITLIFLIPGQYSLASTTISVPVANGSDDVEELVDGSMYFSSSDLELTYDTHLVSGHQKVGLRFNGVDIPADATIINAYIQFTVDETPSGATNLTIKGESSADAQGFTSVSGNLSARPLTGSSVVWTPDPWSTVGEAGTAQQTPNIASIIEEIVASSNGWISGNSLAIIITGTGERVAESYDGVPSAAPVLHVEFDTSTGETGETGGEGNFVIEGNVGIGTDIPEQRLHISQEAGVGLLIESPSSQNAPSLTFRGTFGGYTGTGSITWDSNNERFNLGAPGGFSISEGGNIFWGGVSAPGYITRNNETGINIYGREGVIIKTKNDDSASVTIPHGSFSVRNNALVVNTNDHVSIGTTYNQEKLTVYDGNIFILGGSSINNGLRLQYGIDSSFWVNTTSGSKLQIGGIGGTAPIQGAMTILHNGNIGLGTASPLRKLHVNGGALFEDSHGDTLQIVDHNVPNRVSMYVDDPSASTKLFFFGGSNANGYSMGHFGVQALKTSIKGGNVGIGTDNPAYPLHMASGAHVTVAGVWTNNSSRKDKENIRELSDKEAMETLLALKPQKYNYKNEKDEEYLGFIAEDVPDLVAMKDRNGLSSMDIVAVLTKVVKQQQGIIKKMDDRIRQLESKDLMSKFQRLPLDINEEAHNE